MRKVSEFFVAAVGLLLFLVWLVLPLHAQRSNTFYVDQSPGGTVGDKLRVTQAKCNPNYPCVLILDSSLAPYPDGVLPSRGASETWVDYRKAGSISFTPMNFKVGNGVRYADQFSGANVQAQIDAAAADLAGTYGVVVIPSTLGAGCASSHPLNVTFLDYRGGVVPCGDGYITYNGQTGDGLSPDSGVHSLLRVSDTRTPNNRSEEVLTVIGAFGGDFSNGLNASLEGLTSSCWIYGAASNIPATMFCVGHEGVARVGTSTAVTIPDMRGSTAGIVLDGGNRANVTQAQAYYAQQFIIGAGNTGTIQDAYGMVFDPQTAGTRRNYSTWVRGHQLWGNGSPLNIDYIDSSGTVVPYQQTDGSDNLIYKSLGGFVSWRSKGTANSYLKWASPNLDVDPDGAGFRLRVLGAGGIQVGANGNTVKQISHARASGCATAATAGAVCTTTVTWPGSFSDGTYTAVCSGDLVTSGVPVNGGLSAKAAASVTFRTVAVTAAAAQFTTIDCVAYHD